MYQLTKIPQMSEVCYIPKKKALKEIPLTLAKFMCIMLQSKSNFSNNIQVRHKE